jgi:hypothetical protein
MKLEDYFQLTLEQRIERAEKSNTNQHQGTKLCTLDEYYAITDSISFLEKLRAYQINDIMSRMATSKYKLF